MRIHGLYEKASEWRPLSLAAASGATCSILYIAPLSILTIPNAQVGAAFVDVDDVAAAHCLALFTPHAYGRHAILLAVPKGDA